MVEDGFSILELADTDCVGEMLWESDDAVVDSSSELD